MFSEARVLPHHATALRIELLAKQHIILDGPYLKITQLDGLHSKVNTYGGDVLADELALAIPVWQRRQNRVLDYAFDESVFTTICCACIKLCRDACDCCKHGAALQCNARAPVPQT